MESKTIVAHCTRRFESREERRGIVSGEFQKLIASESAFAARRWYCGNLEGSQVILFLSKLEYVPEYWEASVLFSSWTHRIVLIGSWLERFSGVSRVQYWEILPIHSTLSLVFLALNFTFW